MERYSRPHPQQVCQNRDSVWSSVGYMAVFSALGLVYTSLSVSVRLWRSSIRHAERFVVPEGFFRKRWDYEGLRSEALGTDLEQSWAHMSRENRTLLDAVAERVQHTMHALGEGREVFGLIHADFYERNYLFSQGKVHAIDFDGCGWGYYLFDIGVAFSTLLARSEYPALRQAFLTGYRRVRPLSVDHEALLATFIAARLMCHVLWLAAHLDEPSYGTRAARRIEYELGELQAFLASQR